MTENGEQQTFLMSRGAFFQKETTLRPFPLSRIRFPDFFLSLDFQPSLKSFTYTVHLLRPWSRSRFRAAANHLPWNQIRRFLDPFGTSLSHTVVFSVSDLLLVWGVRGSTTEYSFPQSPPWACQSSTSVAGSLLASVRHALLRRWLLSIQSCNPSLKPHLGSVVPQQTPVSVGQVGIGN